MRSRYECRTAGALAATLLAGLAFAGSASAAGTNPFGCRASDTAVRLGSTVVEPYVANRAMTPCADDQAGVSQATVPGGSPGVATAGPAGAYTSAMGASGASAVTSVDGGSLTGAGAAVSIAGPVQTQASYACVNGGLVASGSSDVTAAVVNGQTVRPASPGAQTTEQLAGGSYVTINQQVQTPTSLTERAVIVHIAGVGDYVLGESQVTADPGACAGGSGSGGSGSGGSGSGGAGSGGGGSGVDTGPCPSGSSLVATDQECEILAAGQAHGIVIAKPFAGPTGASVMSLAAARRKYKSACLAGKGPKFAVVGSNRADRIIGGRQAERILALGGNDTVTVRRGLTCVDGGAGNDTISGANARVRLYGGAGKDRISARNAVDYVNGGAGADRIALGNGRDRVFGGAGNDTIRLGNGRDSAWGGAGRDVIRAGKGRDRLFGGVGNDRLSATGPIEYLNGGRGQDVATAVATQMRYAHRHGCERVRRLRVA